MRSHRPRLLTLAALLFAGVVSNAGCTYYTVYSQPRGTVHTGTASVGTSVGACCQTQCTTCGVLANGLVGYETYEGQTLDLVQYVHVLQPAIDTYGFDYVLIDCPPSLSLLTVNAMIAAQSVLVPLQAEFFALEGLSQLMLTIRTVRQSANRDLRIDGVVLTTAPAIAIHKVRARAND